MTSAPNWLPPLVLFTDFDGNWEVYEEELYRFFSRDFIDSKPFYDGKNVGLLHRPSFDGKDGTFWHIISDGKIEEDRLPNLRRCGCIRWPRPIIENSKDNQIKVWEKRKGGKRKVLLWLEDSDYLVILLMRPTHMLFLSSYPIEYPHTKRRLIKEYNHWKKVSTAST